jgi:DNA gyrase subunit B
VSCVNALSEWLEVTVKRDGKTHRMSFRRGARHDPLRVVGPAEGTGTQVVYKPDATIFRTTEIQYEIVEKRLRELAYLMGTRNVAIELVDERTGAKDHFEYPQGLVGFVQSINKNKTALHAEIVHFSKSVRARSTPTASTRSSSRCSGRTPTRRPSTPSSTTSTRTAAARTSRA